MPRAIPSALMAAAVFLQASAPQALPASPFERARMARQALQAREFLQAGQLFQAAFAAGWKRADDAYDGACCLALAGDRNGAFALLGTATDLGFHSAATLRGDDDLSSLRSDPRWIPLETRIAAKDASFRKVHSDPDGTAFSTADIARFWSVYDRLPGSPDPADLLQRDYLDKGTPGLQDFTVLRIGSGRLLLKVIQAHKAYFDAIRPNTLGLERLEPTVRSAFRNLKALYPDATFPDVYLTVGAMNSGGTASSQGLLLGVELFGRGPGVPIGELDPWLASVVKGPDDLPKIIAHELIHFQQPGDGNHTLLAECLREGSADFLGELISGGLSNTNIRDYGLAHEAELWKAFRADMDGQDTSRWMYQGKIVDGRPADLGYFVGYRIAQAYYAKAKDKRQAVKDIIEMKDPKALLKASGYDPAP
ncbi:MAG TPA: hypothetical protein VFF77_09070 [Holophagaceae bacterium]|nr:hypothetical protein [Holophagaceae bacterium]